MARPKTKDIWYLNVCLEKGLHEDFNKFCKENGYSKVYATEQAIKNFMEREKTPVKQRRKEPKRSIF